MAPFPYLKMTTGKYEVVLRNELMIQLKQVSNMNTVFFLKLITDGYACLYTVFLSIFPLDFREATTLFVLLRMLTLSPKH